MKNIPIILLNTQFPASSPAPTKSPWFFRAPFEFCESNLTKKECSGWPSYFDTRLFLLIPSPGSKIDQSQPHSDSLEITTMSDENNELSLDRSQCQKQSPSCTFSTICL